MPWGSRVHLRSYPIGRRIARKVVPSSPGEADCNDRGRGPSNESGATYVGCDWRFVSGSVLGRRCDRVDWLCGDSANRLKFAAFVIAAAWTSLIVAVAARDGFAPGVIGPFPAPVIAFLVLMIGGLVTWFAWPAFRSALLSLPLAGLVGINAFRIGGLCFLILPARSGAARGALCDCRRLGRYYYRRRRGSLSRRWQLGEGGSSWAVNRLERFRHARPDRCHDPGRPFAARYPVPPLYRGARHRSDGSASVGGSPNIARTTLPDDAPHNRRTSSDGGHRIRDSTRAG